jgi:hypothetical protein
MPNWCTNKVILIATSDKLLTQLGKVLSTNEDLFNQLIPRPPQYDEEEWSDWNIHNWGTKWDATPRNIYWPDKYTVNFEIYTAWEPPIAFYENMERMGYVVNGYYLEEGMGLLGVYYEGNHDKYEFSNLTANEMVNKLPSWVDELFGLIESARTREIDEQEEMQREIEESWEKTDWISGKIKPIRNGLYEVKRKISGNRLGFPFKLEWIKGSWKNKLDVAEWRGITQSQHEQLVSEKNTLMDLEDGLEDLKAELEQLLAGEDQTELDEDDHQSKKE